MITTYLIRRNFVGRKWWIFWKVMKISPDKVSPDKIIKICLNEFFPLRFICTSTKDTFTFIGRNFSSSESYARRKFRPKKVSPDEWLFANAAFTPFTWQNFRQTDLSCKISHSRSKILNFTLHSLIRKGSPIPQDYFMTEGEVYNRQVIFMHNYSYALWDCDQ